MATLPPQPPPFDTHKITDVYVKFIAVTVLLTVLSTSTVILRYLSRRATRSWSYDDWAILVALVLAYGFLATTVIVGTVGGAGRHASEYTFPELERYLQIVLANNVIYNCSIAASKASILLFYHRVFVNKRFHLAIKVVGFLVFGFWASAVFGLIFAFNPVQAQWKFWLPSTSINNKALWIAEGTINIILDVIILAMPQTSVWNLQQTKRRKILLSMLFLLGGLVCCVSIVRVVELDKISLLDSSYTIAIPGIWTMAEMNTSIICACLPMLPNLFRSWHGKMPYASKASTTATSQRYFLSNRSTRKDNSIGGGYTDLDGTSSVNRLHTDIELSQEGPSPDLKKNVHAVHVKREFAVDY